MPKSYQLFIESDQLWQDFQKTQVTESLGTRTMYMIW
jgi:hypothetical protein